MVVQGLPINVLNKVRWTPLTIGPQDCSASDVISAGKVTASTKPRYRPKPAPHRADTPIAIAIAVTRALYRTVGDRLLNEDQYFTHQYTWIFGFSTCANQINDNLLGTASGSDYIDYQGTCCISIGRRIKVDININFPTHVSRRVADQGCAKCAVTSK